MAVNTLITFFDRASGESIQKGKEHWIEITSWSWGIAADSSWTKGGGASVGKPNPGAMSWEHPFDLSSVTIMGYLCTGRAFPKAELQVMETTGKGVPETFFTMTMEDVFITGVSNSGSEEGSIVQNVEMVFKTVRIAYQPQDPKTGQLAKPSAFMWDIPAGTASPSS
jgi:type VI secretion system Hcp family effector